MMIKYYTQDQVEKLVNYQLVNAFDDAITAEVKAHYLTTDGIPDELTQQIEMIRKEIMKRMSAAAL